MFKKFSHRLQHCHDVALSMSKASTMQLQQLKAQLAAEMGAPVGIHTMGIPAAFSTLGITISLAIPQLWLGYLILSVLHQPAASVFVWVVLISLLIAGINGITMFMIGKGSMRAVRVHIMLAAISLVLTVVYLLYALSDASYPGVNLTVALVGVIMLLLSGVCIHSTAFYKMLLFTLHNRAWRQLIKLTR